MFSEEKSGDHEARQDEEHVHPDESTGETGHSRMEEDDEKNGDDD